jgi:hypothetical protein
MQELCWLERSIGSIEKAMDLANSLYWNLTVRNYTTDDGEPRWTVPGGEAVIFRTDSRQAVDAFLYGLGLAYAVLPESIIQHIREELDLE